MATDDTDSDALAKLRAQIETYLQQPDGDTRTADRVAALLRAVGRCIADRARAVESEEGYGIAGALTWAAGQHTEAWGKDLVGEVSWRNAFLNLDPEVMEAWARERGWNPDGPAPELDDATLAKMAARDADQY
jgi:hypothetical protein